MIFASVGSQLPFDRLVRTVDEWAAANPDVPVYLQIGDGGYEPRHAPFARVIPVADYRARVRACTLFIAHVGMGSILQGLEERRQMLLMPRRAALSEHTTDHQLHTAEQFRRRPGLLIVEDTAAFQQAMTRLLREPLPAGEAIAATASAELIGNVARFLNQR